VVPVSANGLGISHGFTMFLNKVDEVRKALKVSHISIPTARQDAKPQSNAFYLTRSPQITKTQVRMYYGSGTGGGCCICDEQTLRVQSPDGSTFLLEMTIVL